FLRFGTPSSCCLAFGCGQEPAAGGRPDVALLEVAAADRDVAAFAADLDDRAVAVHLARTSVAQDHRGLAAAMAELLDLVDLVGEGEHRPDRFAEERPVHVVLQPVGHYGDAELV